MAIRNPEIRKLYGLAAGRCSICKINLFESNVNIGEMAHIIAKSPGGARGAEQVVGDINSYENLILLCANHHTEVDNSPSHYTTERLRSIKSEHERYIASVFDADSEKRRRSDIAFLNGFMEFVPFTQLVSFTAYLPHAVNLKLSLVKDMFEEARDSNPHLYPLNDRNLQSYFQLFIDRYYELWNVISGYTVIPGYTDVGGRFQANFSQADSNFYIHMEVNYLPFHEVDRLSKLLKSSKLRFISAYNDLIGFIRERYNEVNLNSYRP